MYSTQFFQHKLTSILKIILEIDYFDPLLSRKDVMFAKKGGTFYYTYRLNILRTLTTIKGN